MKTFTKFASFAVTFALLTTACEKKRDATLPDGEQETLFAISDFGTADAEKSTFSVASRPQAKDLSFGAEALAMNAGGVSLLDTDALNVPGRLKFMFKGLDLQGTPGQKVGVVFTVDRNYVTAYKVVTDLNSLSLIERNLAMPAAAVKAGAEAARTTDNKKLQSLNALKAKLMATRASQKTGTFLVPLLMYKVEAYGQIQRKKNELHDETSTLELKATDFAVASHVKISNDPSKKEPVACAPSERQACREIFVADRIDNKLMTAGQLRDELGVNTRLEDDTEVTTLLGAGSLNIFEVTTIAKANLSAAEREILKSNVQNGDVVRCSKELRALSQSEAAKSDDCILVRRFTTKISYVSPRLDEATWDGAISPSIKYDSVARRSATGLVRIARNDLVEAVGSARLRDPRFIVKLSDIKGKEFFFRRTATEATATAPIGTGFGGPVLLVKFELKENRLVVRRTEQIVKFTRDERDLDKEEVMSFPVTYLRETTVDAAGSKYYTPMLEESTAEQATHAFINWTNNQIPTVYSPFAFYAQSECFQSINDLRMSDLDLRLDQGSFNFTIDYTATLARTMECVKLFSTSQDYDPSGEPVAMVQKAKERVSFRVNDGSIEKPYVPVVPFQVQNALGYGVFTTGKLRPSVNGTTGLVGQEDNYAYTHDFRDGKKLVYVIAGLPKAEGRKITVDGEEIDLYETYKQLTRDVVADWNKALHEAFAGTSLDRAGDYIEVVVNGEDGVDAKLGDLDKNFIYYEETFNYSNPLGISQNGVNPRSGISVSDFVVMYSGNFRNNLEYIRHRAKIVADFAKEVKDLRELALQQLKANPEDKPAVDGVMSKPVATNATATQADQTRKLVEQIANVKGLVAGRLAKQIGDVRRTDLTGLEAILGDKAYVHRLFRKAAELGTARSLDDVEMIVAQELMTTYGQNGKLSVADKVALQKQIGALSARKRMAQIASSTAGCFFPSRDDLKAEFNGASYKVALVNFMKAALAHEMGHSLGLTHNFAGNTDPRNFFRKGEENVRFKGLEVDDLDHPGQKKTVFDLRATSSIMDYNVPEDDHLYAGPGRYDVAAIRKAYTGKIELENGGDLDINQVKSAFGGNWLQLTSATAKDLNKAIQQGLKTEIRNYRYCTDKDVMETPDCNRFDSGRNVKEVVQNIKANYEQLYHTAYHDFDRQTFNMANKAGVIGRVISTLLDARIFMDEYIYQLATGTSSDAKDGASMDDAERAAFKARGDAKLTAEELARIPSQSIMYREAAKEAYKLLLGIIGTPDSDQKFEAKKEIGDKKFSARLNAVPYEYERVVNGQKQTFKDIAIIEARSVSDISNGTERFDTIGIELDKVIAMEILTLKGFPHHKYREASLALSFLDFEKIAMKIEDPAKSPVMGTIVSLLKNDFHTFFTTDALSAGQTVPEFRTFSDSATVTQAMRQYAAMNAVIGLEAMALKDADNFANLFKVQTFVGEAPADRVSVLRVGADPKSTQRVSFAAIDGGKMSGSMVADAANLQPYSQNAEGLKVKTRALFEALGTNDQEKITAAKVELLKFIKESGFQPKSLLTQPEMAGQNDVAAVAVEYTARTLAKVAQPDFLGKLVPIVKKILKDQDEGRGQDPNDIQQVVGPIQEIKQANAQIAALIPFVGAAHNVLKSDAIKAAQDLEDDAPERKDAIAKYVVLNMVLDAADPESKLAYIVNSLDLMAQMTMMTNREFSSTK